MESIYLVGAEDVRTAAARISSAAEEMKRAANLIDEAFRNQQRFLDEWLSRFEQVVVHMK